MIIFILTLILIFWHFLFLAFLNVSWYFFLLDIKFKFSWLYSSPHRMAEDKWIHSFACGLCFFFFILTFFFFFLFHECRKYRFLCCGLGITGDIKDCVYIFNANFHYTVRPLEWKIIFSKKKGIMQNNKLQKSYLQGPLWRHCV